MGTFREERRGAVEVWTLDAEDTRNAISRAVLAELEARVARVAAGKDVRAVILTGAGDKAFCAGADLKERATMSEAEVRAFLGGLRRTLRVLETSGAVYIAAINGSALGGGTELALACDLRIAAPAAELGLTEVRLGIIPGGGGTQRLPRAIPVGLAMEMIFTARHITADEAYRIGLVNRVVPAAELMAEARTLAGALANSAPVAMRYIIAAVNNGLEMPFAEACQYEATLFGLVASTEDMREGTKAFLEKRKPEFKGK
jgi:enoyl-CoA hydratase/carnithine racemase